MKSPLRVTIITRRHIVFALGFIVVLVGVWKGVGALSGWNRAEQTTARPVLSMSEPVRQVAGAQKQMALTINVDWGNEVIPQILEVLEEKEVKATFFLTGRWATKFPEMAKVIAEHGHEIGNHGLSHAHPTQLSADALARHIAGNVEALREATGVDPVPLYAPPYGEQDARVVDLAKSHGLWTTLWTLDTIDWQNPAPATILQRIVPRAIDGGIVLMHPKEQSLEALPSMIDGVREKGFAWVPLHAMITGVRDGVGDGAGTD